MNEFTVKTEHFEGPLELLLNLIEKRKLHISDFSLAQVTDDYITHINEPGKFTMAGAAHFILIASTLLLIKSKSLLPNLSLTEEERSDIDDLEKRLRLYQRFKELSLEIKKLFGKKPIILGEGRKQQEIFFSPDPKITQVSMLSSLRNVLQSIPTKSFVPQAIVKKVVSLEEVIKSLTDRIQKSFKMSFREFSGGGKTEKVTVIVSFLAMLELVKQGIISVSQERSFDDIHMEHNDIGVPAYE